MSSLFTTRQFLSIFFHVEYDFDTPGAMDTRDFIDLDATLYIVMILESSFFGSFMLHKPSNRPYKKCLDHYQDVQIIHSTLQNKL